VPLDFRSGLAQQRLDQRGRSDVRLTERRGVEVVSDPGYRMDGNSLGDLGLVTGQGPQPDAQRVCERLREGRQQHPCLRVSPGQVNRPVQCHDRFAGARTAAYPGGSVVVAVDEPTLRRMQEDRPFIPRIIERTLQFLDVGDHPEPALRVGMIERVDNRQERGTVDTEGHIGPIFGCDGDFGRSAGCESQQGFGGLLRQAFGDIEQGVFIGPADLVEPRGRYAVTEQRIVGDPGEQQRFVCGSRCDGGRYCDMLDPLGEFDELGRACRRVAFDPPPLSPRISSIVMPDITKQHARGRSMDDQPDIFIDANRPEVRVTRPFEPMKAQARIRQVQLQIKRCGLDRLLFGAVQPGEAGGEGIGDAELHHRTDIARASRRGPPGRSSA
jgi:hypothetical protein